MKPTISDKEKPIIRISRGYAGHYLYRLSNRKTFDEFLLCWRLSYWVFNPEYILEALKEIETGKQNSKIAKWNP